MEVYEHAKRWLNTLPLPARVSCVTPPYTTLTHLQASLSGHCPPESSLEGFSPGLMQLLYCKDCPLDYHNPFMTNLGLNDYSISLIVTTYCVWGHKANLSLSLQLIGTGMGYGTADRYRYETGTVHLWGTCARSVSGSAAGLCVSINALLTCECLVIYPTKDC